MSDLFNLVKSDYQKQYDTLSTLVRWDPSVVSPRGSFNFTKVARFYDTTPYQAEIMIKGLKTYLEKHVDDNDFCNLIQWCFLRTPKVSQ